MPIKAGRISSLLATLGQKLFRMHSGVLKRAGGGLRAPSSGTRPAISTELTYLAAYKARVY